MRKAGVLLPVASLPSTEGIGDFGKSSYEFIDQLAQCGFGVWQILPLNPLGYGNSPYQPYSSMAGDEIYISLLKLKEEGFLCEIKEELSTDFIDYERVRAYKGKYLQQAFANFKGDQKYERFCAQEWVYLYAVFLTLKKKNNLICWNEWPLEQKKWITDRTFDISVYEEEIAYEMFVQYKFYTQWIEVKAYANAKGIQIMGDIPIYVGIDSLDVWANQENFLLDENGKPVFIAGVPPDYFSATGQRWGNPIYNWAYMKQNGFRFWIDRLAYHQKLFDIVRIDHFRAFDTYWQIPVSCETAIEGEWLQAPGYELFDLIGKKLPGLHIVAEDLGELRKEVYELRDHYGFKGMKIIQFTYDPKEGNNNFEDVTNMIIYTGTHDNQTITGWYEFQDQETKDAVDIDMAGLGFDGDTPAEQFIQMAFDSIADYAIIPMQDILEFSDTARLNTPGTLGSPNWEWKMKDFQGLLHKISFLKKEIVKSSRNDTQDRIPWISKKREERRMLEKIIAIKYNKKLADCTNEEIYASLLELVKRLANKNADKTDKKKLYYISAEFLIGKLLSNNLINLGIYENVKEELKNNGKDLAQIEEMEPEPSLGNGGLGRLAACFLDSIATLGLNGDGMGLNYHFGLFKQTFEDNLQKEITNPWIETPGWLTKKEVSFEIPFKDFKVTSSMYDIDVIGYENRTNQLHLFDIDTVDESLVQEGIAFDKEEIRRNLTLFLYPDDSDEQGELLRIYQQYFMVSSSAQYILEECIQKGSNLYDLPEYAVIQINDTHPTMVIPELIRLLVQRGMEMDTAIEVVTKTCAYTNHTILAEALEKWPMAYLKQVVPQLVPIIEVLDDKVRRKFDDEKVFIIDKQERVHMAHIDIHYGYRVNGVASLHTDILKEEELLSFSKIYPEKFNNKTNGITFRRWLLHSNHELTNYLTGIIGDGYKKDAKELEKLLDFSDQKEVLHKIQEIKKDNKIALKQYLFDTQGIEVSENAIFDIQVKRLHEYKRQQMNALYIIYKYLDIKKGNIPATPITMIFGAKAAPAYIIAKDIIHLLLCLQEIIQNDPKVSPYLNVVMVENYNVSKAEKLIPACDVSEQISLASKEASGTGNMKFMLNGAVTLGTMDGANVEIAELVGEENCYIFGESSQQVIAHYKKEDYIAKKYYTANKMIKELVDFIISKEIIAVGCEENLKRLHNELIQKDWFMTLLDLEDYIKTKDQVFADYEDRDQWARKMLVNIARAGYFSSDRTIEEYNRDIWKLEQ